MEWHVYASVYKQLLQWYCFQIISEYIIVQLNDNLLEVSSQQKYI